jgi:signal transduction histidine kinase
MRWLELTGSTRPSSLIRGGRLVLLDVALAVALDVATALPLVHDGERSATVWLLDQALVLPLIFRRRYPSAVFALIALLASLQWTFGIRLAADAALLVALYTVAAIEPRRRAVTAAAVLELGVVLASIRFAPTGDGIIGSLVFLSGLVTAAFVLGTSGQTRRQYLDSLEERAQRLEVERDQQGRLSAVAERTRIAREMHDIVAHNLAVMIALAEGAAAIVPTDPEGSSAAMRQVAETGRGALGEMRHLLGVLRDEQGLTGTAPQPGLDDLPELMAQVRSTGLAARLETRGQPRALSDTMQLTVFRAVQEALTNTMKHAPSATSATVVLDWRSDVLQVCVTDDGAPVTPSSESQGHGLSGMRERLALHGGALSFGAERGGWLVRVQLPLQEVSA